jgi:hypothetical protein
MWFEKKIALPYSFPGNSEYKIDTNCAQEAHKTQKQSHRTEIDINPKSHQNALKACNRFLKICNKLPKNGGFGKS